MGTRNKVENKTQEVKGEVKERLGKATDDERMQAEGRGDQLAGNVKQAAEKVKDAFR